MKRAIRFLAYVKFVLDDHLQRFRHRVGVGVQTLIAQHGAVVAIDGQPGQPVGHVFDLEHAVVFGSPGCGDNRVARFVGCFGRVADAGKG